jgi:hypothetical protein
LEAPELSATVSESVKEIKSHFAIFIRQLIGSFSLEQRRNLFYLFASWAGKYGQPFVKQSQSQSQATGQEVQNQNLSAEIQEFEYSSLRAMIAVLCCGSNFDDNTEDVNTFLGK